MAVSVIFWPLSAIFWPLSPPPHLKQFPWRPPQCDLAGLRGIKKMMGHAVTCSAVRTQSVVTETSPVPVAAEAGRSHSLHPQGDDPRQSAALTNKSPSATTTRAVLTAMPTDPRQINVGPCSDGSFSQ